eukprot:TRINITY_DN47880_c0_g1_i1.p1 TRINITY_DN47880_c0_g1~~TRINITY_DN47880_c0_g1_i1.p1  ORF type:complete len:236 (+),score=41.47 TRINITY_DN47880_c0_g1_i1:65-709(+)
MGHDSSTLSAAVPGDVLSGPYETSRGFTWQDFTMSSRRYNVQLALTSLSPRMATAVGVPEAYHSSIIVDGDEYSFSKSGLVRARNYLSHKHLNGPTLVLPMGTSPVGGMDMAKALRNYFRPNTYDLLLKNCNHFSDCALHFMLGQRLPEKFKAAEELGASVEKNLGLVKMLSLGDYHPNPQALSFDLGSVLLRVGVSEVVDSREGMRRVAHAGG